jgi:hypothetical protein
MTALVIQMEAQTVDPTGGGGVLARRQARNAAKTDAKTSPSQSVAS